VQSGTSAEAGTTPARLDDHHHYRGRDLIAVMNHATMLDSRLPGSALDERETEPSVHAQVTVADVVVEGRRHLHQQSRDDPGRTVRT
jgi:hypothetical protein